MPTRGGKLNGPRAMDLHCGFVVNVEVAKDQANSTHGALLRPPLGSLPILKYRIAFNCGKIIAVYIHDDGEASLTREIFQRAHPAHCQRTMKHSDLRRGGRRQRKNGGPPRARRCPRDRA
eukprot:7424010-Pyramimonas_sp.AAC.1